MDPFSSQGPPKSYCSFGNVFQRLSMAHSTKPTIRKAFVLPHSSEAIDFWNYRDIIAGDEAEQERQERANRIAMTRIAASKSSAPEYHQAILRNLTSHVQKLDQLSEW
ncbi:anaphase-promoting complex subunit Apc14 [Schizosaccharomyces octosporus yFS286]|uniref:Anaphase-promoting complex subunit Apc14 n=1 Tax=Schizosaccharomyces octosporus (strain yFS286) TaxID=483514 RepID=S9PYM8_SCHOY|nr:anaphase-promoting complex subunit Apc14 [Schizosaccharomyces octosporus yFS286]EPX73067.1 anaphase-promoting complex subunit Apc14 [Schizosaccharomyces octosporus yFS286]